MPPSGQLKPNRTGTAGEYWRRISVHVPLGVVLLGGIVSGGAAPAQAQNQAQSFDALAARCAPSVNIQTLSAIVMQESGGRQFAIGINRARQLPRQPTTEAEAVATARWLIQSGYNFDAGLGQINSSNFRALGLTPETLFDPCTNLRSAASVLTECYGRSSRAYSGQTALHAALSCYNTGNMRRGFANGYVQKVVSKVALSVPALRPAAVPPSAPAATPRAAGDVAPDAATVDLVELAAEANRDNPARDGMGDAFSRAPRDAFTPAPAAAALAETADAPVMLTVSAKSW